MDSISEAVDWILAHAAKNIAFKGDLGAGKTTLIKALCEKLGVQDAMSSPTFSIVNEYHSPKGIIYHFDFYRLKEPEEALDFGIDEYFESASHCFMEWPEMIGDYLPKDCLRLCIQKESSTERRISVC